MPTDHRHRGCSTPVLRWLPDAMPTPGQRIRAADWLLIQEGRQPEPWEHVPDCPDCGERLAFKGEMLEGVPSASRQEAIA